MYSELVFFFFKQKTAYEITRRDWSSDVCSSDLRTIWGRPATSTRGFGTRTPPAASRDPSPPARISPCTSVQHLFDVRESRDPGRGDEAPRRAAVGRREPARPHPQRRGGADVRFEVVAHHPRPLWRHAQRVQGVCEDARVGFAPPHQG